MKTCFVILAVAVVACHTNESLKSGPVDPTIGCITSGPTVTPAAATLHRGDSLQLIGQDVSCGVPPQHHRIRWTTSDGAVATVDSLGMAHARATGGATIILQWVDEPTVTGAMALTVIP